MRPRCFWCLILAPLRLFPARSDRPDSKTDRSRPGGVRLLVIFMTTLMFGMFRPINYKQGIVYIMADHVAVRRSNIWFLFYPSCGNFVASWFQGGLEVDRRNRSQFNWSRSTKSVRLMPNAFLLVCWGTSRAPWRLHMSRFVRLKLQRYSFYEDLTTEESCRSL